MSGKKGGGKGKGRSAVQAGYTFNGVTAPF